MLWGRDSVSSVKEHYDGLLGPVYSWILGDFDAAYAKNDALFDRLQVVSGAGKRAIDLGSGPGCQSIPLAERGYDVLAIDFCENLLVELRQRSGDLQVRTACDDILNFDAHINDPVELIVCMGDTLCHLPDTHAVATLLQKVADNLVAGGQFITSFRDYVSAEPTGADRFIPVRSSDEQIFTCFLEFKEEVVSIHDILYRKEDDKWKLDISEYDKIKVDPNEVLSQLRQHRMTARQLDDSGMIVIQAEMPA